MLLLFILLCLIFFVYLIISTNNEYFKDYGVIKPYVRNYRYYGIKAEIHPLQMIGLLNFLQKKYPESIIDTKVSNNKELKTYENVKVWINNLISKVACSMAVDDIELIENIEDEIKINELKKFRKIQNNNSFEIIDDELLQTEISNLQRINKFKFVITLYREPAEIGYIIYLDISYDKVNARYSINNFKVLGVLMEDQIKLKNKDLDESCSIQEPNEKCNNNLSFSNDYDEKKQKFMESIQLNKAIDRENELFKCFFKDALNKNECESYELIKKEGTTETIKSNPGLWAKSRCTIDEECPFFKANQNYPNTRGGCKRDGYCEMPVNVTAITPTMAQYNNQPLCYNCRKNNCEGLECLKCCDDQMDKNKYPNLVTPDYMFENDTTVRLENESYFTTKGYSPTKTNF